jgi:CRP/FNR family transcriptional regulator
MVRNNKQPKTEAKRTKSNFPFGNPKINELLELAENKQFLALSRNDRLFLENEKVKGVYFLLSGKIKIVKSDSENKDSVLYLIKAPDIICLHSILEEEYHIHTAVAAADSMVCFVPKKEFEKILANNMNIAFNMMKMLCLKINIIENQIQKHI